MLCACMCACIWKMYAISITKVTDVLCALISAPKCERFAILGAVGMGSFFTCSIKVRDC